MHLYKRKNWLDQDLIGPVLNFNILECPRRGRLPLPFNLWLTRSDWSLVSHRKMRSLWLQRSRHLKWEASLPILLSFVVFTGSQSLLLSQIFRTCIFQVSILQPAPSTQVVIMITSVNRINAYDDTISINLCCNRLVCNRPTSFFNKDRKIDLIVLYIVSLKDLIEFSKKECLQRISGHHKRPVCLCINFDKPSHSFMIRVQNTHLGQEKFRF